MPTPLEIGYVVARSSPAASQESGTRDAISGDEKLQELIGDPMGLERAPHHDPECPWCAGYRRSIEFAVARSVANLPYRAVTGVGIHTPQGRVAAALDGAIARAAATEALADPSVDEQVRDWVRIWSGDVDTGGGARVGGTAGVLPDRRGGRGFFSRESITFIRDIASRIAVSVFGFF